MPALASLEGLLVSTAAESAQQPPRQAAPGSPFPLTFLLGVLHLQQALASWKATQAQVTSLVLRAAQHVTCARQSQACAPLLMPLQPAL